MTIIKLGIVAFEGDKVLVDNPSCMVLIPFPLQYEGRELSASENIACKKAQIKVVEAYEKCGFKKFKANKIMLKSW
jgi:predicted dinucleotide-binding enzyme